MFENLTDRLQDIFGKMGRKGKLTEQDVDQVLREVKLAMLGAPGKLDYGSRSPAVLMLVGLQGSGKTTTAAKLGLYLRKQGLHPLLVAADVYRPAAIDQLVTLGKNL